MPFTLAKPTYKVPRGAAVTRVHEAAFNSPPTKGLDISLPFTEQDPLTGVVVDNFFVRRFGPVLRKGSERWVSNLDGEVLSIMSYNPPRGSGGSYSSKLFAATDNESIYDVTSQIAESTTPTPVATLTGQTTPGVLSWVNFSNTSTNFLVVCAAGAGVWTYDSVGGWVDRTAGITVGPAINFDFVMVWMNRLWFIEKDTSKAWYLPTNAIAGAAAAFDFGPLFVHGGDLQAMASWTVDGGDGIDDKLVMVADSGDLLIYEGTDPTSATTFRMVGRWFVGRPPAGRRFMSKYGGDLTLITERGIEYMSRILQARGLLDPETERNDPARRYNEVIGNDVRATRSQMFWQFVAVISEECMILTTPHNLPISGIQYCFNLLPKGWSRMKGMGMSCAEVYGGDLYHGTLDGTVIKAFTGLTDDALSDGTVGRSVIGDIQTAFVPPGGNRINLKRPLLVNPVFISPGPPSVKVQINSDWSTKSVSGSPAYVITPEALWDDALWDEAVWAGEANTYQGWIGTEGLGCYFSLRMSVQGLPGTTFTGWKFVHDVGGIM